MVLSPQDFLALRPPMEAIELEGHGKVWIRGLQADERDEYEQSLIERGPDGRSRVKRHQRNVRASLVVRCLVNEQGERMFQDNEVEALGKVDASIIDKLWDKARKLSGMDTEAIQALAEGFGSAQPDGNSSE
jgi:hypothetical protein